ncbi:LysR family transcriptional regulator [Microbacterium sp. NPDC058342]|uniref:LysR family transcriptional regulator n=1 Tax=Microbacterium sp. NPDC058342 TaxID=3346454 RepID=UPI003664B051
MNIEVRHLRMLCAIADAGSLSRAAADLGLSQPSVTSALRRLEAHVAGRLFWRSHRGVEPTELGIRLISRARIALAEVDQLEGELSARRFGGPLRIGISQMSCTPQIIANLDAAFGASTTFSVDGSTAVLAHELKHRRHDLSVVVVSEDNKRELPGDVHVRVIQPSVPVFVALPERHRLAGCTEVELADLASDAWVGPPGADDGSLAELRAACADAGFVPNVRFVVPAGVGRSIVTQTDAVQLVEPASPETPGLVTRPLVGDPIRLRLVLAWQRDDVRRDAPDIAHRAAMSAYTQFARSSPVYVDWWRRSRAEKSWAKQLDPVFAD